MKMLLMQFMEEMKTEKQKTFKHFVILDIDSKFPIFKLNKQNAQTSVLFTEFAKSGILLTLLFIL